jgi:hypothetical protein
VRILGFEELTYSLVKESKRGKAAFPWMHPTSYTESERGCPKAGGATNAYVGVAEGSGAVGCSSGRGTGARLVRRRRAKPMTIRPPPSITNLVVSDKFIKPSRIAVMRLYLAIWVPEPML